MVIKTRNFTVLMVVMVISIIQSVQRVDGFGTQRWSGPMGLRQGTRLNGMFDGLSKAFANDDSLGKAQNAGLSGGPDVNDKVSINGKPVNAVVGQKVSVVAAGARVKINYDCRNGDCGTCMIKMNGRKVKACQMNIPKGACKIETLY